ncbi:phosphatidylinositol-glycan biosynthesis class X protein [Elysia marginata]|uniref:Phosphatidylinositol-glycan biosynthesis class X protein n=1 Tax=Elysia marginata TaxID=1093978 RepID=A0AAV4HNV6_9GAST|nr:phosphatidylinositol-glycan biosynthesis class X protein [Elysia marginata]
MDQFITACCLLFPVLASGTLSKDNFVIERKLGGHGFHRDLETIIHLPHKLQSEVAGPGCILLMYQVLPAGVYADPFQIHNLNQFGFPEVVFDRIVDIEAAEYASKSHELYLFIELSAYKPNKVTGHLNIEISLPIHARYHIPFLTERGTEPRAKISILHPGLYSNCSQPDVHNTLRAPCNPSNSSYCDWAQVSYISYSPQVELSIPVGEERHKPLVITVTLLVTTVICALLCKTIFTHNSDRPDKES